MQNLGVTQTLQISQGWTDKTRASVEKVYPLLKRISGLKDIKGLAVSIGAIISITVFFAFIIYFGTTRPPSEIRTGLTWFEVGIGLLPMFLVIGVGVLAGRLIGDIRTKGSLSAVETTFEQLYRNRKEELLSALSVIKTFEPELLRKIRKPLRREIEKELAKT